MFAKCSLPRQVLVDINWRPVFWADVDEAPGVILPYVSKADIVKLSDEEAEWLFGLSASDALQHPDKAGPALLLLLPCVNTCPLHSTMLAFFSEQACDHMVYRAGAGAVAGCEGCVGDGGRCWMLLRIPGGWRQD